MEDMCSLCKRKREIYAKGICKSCYTLVRYRSNPAVKKSMAESHEKWKSGIDWNKYMRGYYGKNKASLQKYQKRKQREYWKQKKELLKWVNALAYKYDLKLLSLNDFKVSDVRRIMSLKEDKLKKAFFKWYAVRR
jgi:hypothetical protein